MAVPANYAGAFPMIPPGIVRLPPDHLANLAPLLAMIQRSGWLALGLVGTVVAAAIWLLLRIRRRVDAEASLHLLVNSIAAVSVLAVLSLGFAAVEILLAPAIALQTLFHVECLPTDRTILTTLVAVALVAAILEGRLRRHHG
jgi:hypothetical protein